MQRHKLDKSRLLLGAKYAPFVDHGRGEYLVPLGIARTFPASVEWSE